MVFMPPAIPWLPIDTYDKFRLPSGSWLMINRWSSQAVVYDDLTGMYYHVGYYAADRYHSIKSYYYLSSLLRGWAIV